MRERFVALGGSLDRMRAGSRIQLRGQFRRRSCCVIRVCLADDQALFRGVRALLAVQGISVIAEAEEARRRREGSRVPPDCCAGCTHARLIESKCLGART